MGLPLLSLSQSPYPWLPKNELVSVIMRDEASEAAAHEAERLRSHLLKRDRSHRTKPDREAARADP